MNFRRKRVWLGMFLAVITSAVLAFRLTPRLGLQQEMEAWRKAGLPTNGDELHTWYTAVPADQNAALLVMEANAQHVYPSKVDPHALELPKLGEPLPPQALEMIAAYLGKNEVVLAKLREAAKLPQSRYPANLWQGMSTLLPHLAPVKKLAQTLKLEAVYHSAKGDRPKAVQSIHTSFALARTLRNEPILISELVRIACVSINLIALERMLNEHQLTADEITLLTQDLAEAEEDGRRAIFRALVGERTNASWAFKTSFREFSALGAPVTPMNFGQQLFGETMFMLYKASGLRERDARAYLQTMSEFIRASTNEFPAAVTRTAEAEKAMDVRLNTGLGRLAVMSRMLLPALTKTVHKEAVAAARLRAARMALRVESYRLANGRLPENLDAIGGEVLTDTFDGTPMRLERLGEGYAVVSDGASAFSKTFWKRKDPIIGIRVTR